MSSGDGFEGEALGRIDDIVGRAVEQGQVPGVVAAVARGKTVHVATAGSMALGGAPMRRDTLFRIASITKPMTTTLLSVPNPGRWRRGIHSSITRTPTITTQVPTPSPRRRESP